MNPWARPYLQHGPNVQARIYNHSVWPKDVRWPLLGPDCKPLDWIRSDIYHFISREPFGSHKLARSCGIDFAELADVLVAILG